MFSINVNNLQLYKEFYSYLLDMNGRNITPNNKHVTWMVKYKNLTITFFENMRIQFNDRPPEELMEEFKKLIDPILYVGSDEVGIGEAIGPLIVCGVKFKNNESKIDASLLGIRDSKKLGHQKIINLYHKLLPLVNYSFVKMEPQKLNALLEQKEYNMKKINALGHNAVHNKLYTSDSKHVIDKFVNEQKYYQYLEKVEILYKDQIIFLEGADDKYLEVSAASIIAKYNFNKWIIDFLLAHNINLKINNKLNTLEIYKRIKSGEYQINDQNNLLKSWMFNK